MKVYEALAEAFRREETNTCFALLGDANMHWAGALAERGTRFVYPRHEHAAVAGAAAFSRVSGQIGCASVTCGPGLTQVMTILPIAVRARLPMVIFAGEAPLRKEWYNQGIDQAPFVEACGAEYLPLHDVSKMIEGVHDAFARAKQKRKPIVIGVPLDLQQDEWSGSLDQPTSDRMFEPPQPTHPEASKIAEAASWISAAERPILLAGLGAIQARAACIAAAEKVGALLATTLPAKGLFHGQSFCIGVAGGYASERSREIFAQSDLVIAVGSRLASHTFDGGKLTPSARVIHIDEEPQLRAQGRDAADLLVKSDAELGMAALTDLISKRTGWRTEETRIASAQALEISNPESPTDDALHPMAAIRRLSEIIPANCHIINTSGHCAYYAAQMNHHAQSHYTVIREFGAIGNGTSFALGVAAAFPERPVVLIDGDGSAMMHIQEIETFKRHNLKVLIIVLNDGAYGSEVHKLRLDGATLEGSVFGRPDFAAVGHGFGLSGRKVTDLGQLSDGLSDFLSNEGPAIMDVHISDQIASPQILRAHSAHH